MTVRIRRIASAAALKKCQRFCRRELRLSRGSVVKSFIRPNRGPSGVKGRLGPFKNLYVECEFPPGEPSLKCDPEKISFPNGYLIRSGAGPFRVPLLRLRWVLSRAFTPPRKARFGGVRVGRRVGPPDPAVTGAQGGAGASTPTSTYPSDG